MKENEFIKEHPSLDGKMILLDLRKVNVFSAKRDEQLRKAISKMVSKLREQVHKTQLDKQKVTEILLENCEPVQYAKIKTELGLE